MTKPKNERILVIRLGALGDLVLCFQAFAEIRAAHPGAEIALLTMPAFAAFARQMPWFDKIIIDDRAPGWRLDRWAALLKQLYAFAPTRVYDLQGKFRQTILYFLMGGPWARQWSGAAPLCSHPRLWPPQPRMHFTDFVAAQLRLADVPSQPTANLDWLDASLESFNLPPHFALLIPGCAPGREYKRWPGPFYAVLAEKLAANGLASVVVGTATDTDAIAVIKIAAPHLIDLSGQTSLLQLAALARRSACVVGNDTGPTHLAASVGAPTLALISGHVDPAWSAPQGSRVAVLQANPLDSLTPDKVFLALQVLLAHKNENSPVKAP